ncbi:non-ribosomal peptide synthase/polyketide synthase [Archangium violaceum]|uniref:non-ribosomal peptide synthase/polyketide synthase n=1 Tax=Archangium violaceum TaxID=83451 RepID=UPI00193BAFBF|nr:non-ribosomal peptide synthetase [Archangium violaceum]QRK08658.1 non-ribosomal peptide synthase/polyketide synthase [Archangium violaceum]
MASRNEFDQLTPGEKRALLKQLLERGAPTGAASPSKDGVGPGPNGVRDTGPARRPASELPVPSSAQERMWFLHQLAPGAASYNIARAVELSGAVDARVLEAALRQLLARHEALRSVFPSSEGRPLLVMRPVPEQVLTTEELTAGAEQEALLSRRLREEATRPFDVEHGPLHRFHLFRLSPQRYVFELVLHHLVLDGWSYNVLMRELGELYTALGRQQAPRLAPLPLEYADFAAWQRTPAAQEREAPHLEYWKRQLADAPHVLELPTDKPRPAVRSEEGVQTEPRPLPASLTEALRALCRERQVTPFMVLYAAFAALLHRYSGQTDFCVGTPVAGRTHLSLEGVVGLFINTVVLRSAVTSRTPFSTLLSQARKTVLASYAHQEAPFERVVEALQVERSLGRTPLVQVMFDLYQEERSLAEALPGLAARPVHVDTGTSQFDLSLTVLESAAGFTLTVQYSTELFEAGTVQRMLEHYVRLLEHALRAPDTHVGALSLLSPSERQQLLFSFNDTERPFDSEATLVSLFEAQVERTPEALAVVAPDGSLTFRELAEQASRLAAHLVAAGARPESIVGLCLERSLDAVVSLLAIFMSGAGCLPLEASHPAARRAALLRQSGARLVVSRPALFSGAELEVPLVSPDMRGQEAVLSAPPPRARAEDLAYLLYTSGSTGEPKGAELTHRNIVHAFASFDPYYVTQPGDCWVACGSFSFDMHLEEVLFSLTRGARTVLREVGPLGLARDIVRHGITHTVITPSSLSTALEEPGALDAFRSMKMIALGGESIPEQLVQQLALSRTSLINAYGPTETTICVVAEQVRAGQPVRLGKPLARSRAYVLDALGQPVPLGVPGELYIGGLGLGRGYHGRPDLTAERFVPDPFSGTPGARLYRTGDRVRWNPDGSLSFLGRSDFQVKVRGVRVELEEVEAALLRQSGVRQASVITRGSGRDMRLEAFLVLENDSALASLRQSLARALPEAMVPSRFHALSSLPFTSSGKVDRKALAALPTEAAEALSQGEPPRGPVEELLAQLFCQVLGVEAVRREDNFFHLGGHSLSATRLVARVRQAFGVELPLTALFSSPSVAGLAHELSLLQGHGSVELPAPTPRPADAPPVLSPAQERLWFIQQLQPDSSAYHMPEAVELSGPLDSLALKQALRWLLARHPVLRLAVPSVEGTPAPRLLPLPEQVLHRESLSELPDASSHLEARLRQEVDRSFDMAQGPLHRCWLWELGPERHVLLLVFHHLLVDGLSLDILMRELGQAYSAFLLHREPSLPPVRLDNSSVALWLRSHPVLSREQSQLDFWKRQLSDAPALLQLPTDKPRPSVLSHQGGFRGYHPLPDSLSLALRTFCRQHQATPFMVLYSAFAALLHRYSGQDDFCVGTPVSGRTHPSTEDVVGLLLNTVVLRSRLQPDASFSSLVAQVRSSTLEAIAHQDVPFERLVSALGVERSPSHSPLFQVMFDLNRVEHSLAGAFPGIQSLRRKLEFFNSPFDLTLTAIESPEGYELFFQYSTELFEAGTVQRMLEHYVRLLEHALRAPDTHVGALSLLSPSERQQLLFSFNDTERPFDSEATLVSLFEAQVERTPEALAVVAPDGSLTFRELAEQASRLAAHLVAAGARPESIVGLCLERSLESVVAPLAILMSGAACLPLEASHPAARRASLLRQSGALLVISRPALFSGVELEVPLLSPDVRAQDVRVQEAVLSAPPPRARADNLAYLLYTSGSTGEPKGVGLSHLNLVHAFASFDEHYATRPGDCWSASTSPSFDVHLEELFFCLTRGARLLLRDVGPLGLARDIVRHGITHVPITPSSLSTALEEPGALEAFRSLSVLILGGEALPPQLVQQLALSRTRLLNMYGPTETTLGIISERILLGQPIRLGKPLARSRAYVLDALGQPVPLGVPGELYIGGLGLGRGYHGRPDLTAERFVPDPFSGTPGARLYRTGDRVRWNPDGSLSFLGRSDFQVKVRGVRIELEEVEAALLRQSGVRQASVITRGSGRDMRLEAFLVLENDSALASLRQSLARALPEAMVPSRFHALSSLPFTSSGKVDRKALAALAVDSGPTVMEGEAPRGHMEELLAQLFCQVLGVESVRREDNFFHLGGHSLSATRLVARVRQAFGVELPLTAFFSSPTVARLAHELSLLQGHGSIELPAPTALPEGAPPVLSPAQERLWFIQQLQPDSSAYHMPEAVELSGPLDSLALEQALRSLLARHPVLRLAVPSVDGTPAPRLLPLPEQVLHHESADALSGEPESLNRWLREKALEPFSMESGPLYRFRLLRLGSERHVLLLVFHHLLVDGLSLDILMRELGQAYSAFRQHREPSLPPVRLDNSSVALWLRSQPVLSREQSQLDFWKHQLSDAPALLQLPTDKPRPSVLSHQGGFSGFHPLPSALSQSLLAFCRQHQATPFMVLYSAFAALLHRYSGQDDFCVGTPVSGRTHPSSEDVVGLLLNTVVLRSRLQPDASFSSLVSDVRASSLEAFAHQDVPFERLVSALGVERNTSHTPLFQVVFNLNRVEHALADALPGLHARPLQPDALGSPFELSFVVTESDQGYTLACRYSTELFEAGTIHRMLGHYQQLLAHALRVPDTRIDALSLLTDAERHRLLVEWNETHVGSSADACLHTLIEAQVARAPDVAAVRLGDEVLTYGELNRRANQLAHHLRRLGVGPEVRVGLGLERSVEMVVGVLGILKAGGAYVPLDPSAPKERLAFMLRDSRAPVLVTRRNLADSLSAPGVRMLCLDTHAPELALEPESNPLPLSGPEHLAYVIYTSGSTGMPKGVMIQHRSVVNLLAALEAAVYAGTQAPLRVSLNAPLSFDASVKQLIQLAHGHTLCIVPEEARGDVSAMLSCIERYRLDVLDCSPAHLRLLLDEGLGARPESSPRRVLVGGEALSASTWAVLAHHPHITFFNVYGPTECTVDTTACAASSRPEGPSIGRPLRDVRVYVLDRNLHPVPVGVPGELFVGGAGLGRGYQERPDLTAEKFIPDPFSSTPGARLYRTGDRVRYLPDGHLEYLERIDFQVKVRGFRIELGEVEAVLGQHPAVSEASVVVHEASPGDKRLVAFVVLGGAPVPEDELRAWLRKSLPEYMVPAALVPLERMPLSRHGKVDRKALAVLAANVGSAATDGESPRGPVEELLAQLFCQVLGVETVRREDDFFHLGGHSLTATRLVARVRQAFGVELPLVALFTSPTVAGLARELSSRQGHGSAELPAPTPRPADAPPVLSFAQERMWFLQQLRPDSHAYHIDGAVEIEGPLQVDALEQALRWLLERHPVLRLAVPSREGNPAPVLLPAPDRVLQLESLAEFPEPGARLAERLRQEVDRPFDMARGPLFRFWLWRLSSERHALLLVFHHLLVDGSSMGILLRELGQAYSAFLQHQPPVLPAVLLDNSDIASWQRAPALLAREEAQLDYWRRQLSDAPRLLQLPTDKPRPSVLSDKGASTSSFRLPDSLSLALGALCRQHQVTPFMVLHAAFSALLFRYSGQQDMCVGVPVSGRTHPSSESVVGLFVNTVVLRSHLHPDASFSSLLSQVRSTSLDAFAHQDVPFEKLINSLGVERSTSHSPLFQVMFDLNRAEHSLADALPGLQVHPLRQDILSSPFDLSLTAVESPEGYEFFFQYSTELFEAGTVQRMLEHYVRLLEHALRAPDTHVGALSLLSPSERQQVLFSFNDTERPFDSEATLVSLFLAQAERTPDAPAVVAPAGTLTFRELAEQSSRLAAHLAAAGARPESIIGLCLERSLDAVVSLLAIFMSGAGCLPLEASHPAARRAALLRQSGAHLVLSRPVLFSGVELPVPLVSPDVRAQEAVLASPPPRARAENLAYLLYTSGSTGEPKGVELTHRNVVHCFAAFDPYYATQPGDCWACSGSLSFDIHLEEVLFSLTRGARTVLREVGPLGLGRDIVRHGITHTVITPSSLATALEEPDALAAFRSLKVLVTGGEVLPDPLVQQLALTKTKLVNTYGPTETSINVVAEHTLPERPVRLGRPLDRCRIYVLDERGEPVPPGVPGELYIGGTPLGRGYRGRPDLTAERFVPDPFSGTPGARLYRTGDRVRWNSDGSLSFLGRSDFQVKVRGVRIELEEVEAALLRQSGVRQAAVITRGSGRDMRLEAFLVLENDSALASLRQSLARSLPEAMVPSRFHARTSLPFTSSGKVDRKALAALPVDAAPEALTQGEPPRGPVEELLAQLFRQVLGVETVSREDDFFHLGGHSLSATRLVARVRQAFGVELPLTTLFSSPSVAGLAHALSLLQGHGSAELPAPTPRPADAPPVLSFAQERMWFLQQLQPDSHAYHIDGALEVEGPLQIDALEQALHWLLERHPVLRLAVSAYEGQPLPRVLPVPDRVLQQESLAERPDASSRLMARLRLEVDRPFDMAQGPLFRFWLWRLSPERHALLLVFHHLLVDGLSLDILMRELGQAYSAFLQHQPPILPAVLLDNSDIASWQRAPALLAREEAQLDYWRRQLSDAPRLLQLPTDKPRPSVLSDKGASTSSFHLPESLSQALGALCRQHQVTPFMVLHAAFSALLFRYCGQQDLCVGVPVSGRTHPSSESVVGLFVNTVVLRSHLRSDASFSSLLSQVRSTSLDAFAHQDVPFEKLVSTLGVERSTSHSPLVQVAFVWNRLGHAMADALPGLTTRAIELSSTASKFDLALIVLENGPSLEISADFSTELFEPGTVRRMQEHYVRLLEHVLHAPDTRLDALPLLSEPEREQVVRSFNETWRPFDTEATHASLFQAQAASTPEALALSARDGTFTYRQLDERATALAHHLAALGAGPESVIGVCLERSSELLVSLLAILKAGAAYLPLEVAHPASRRTALLRSAGARWVVARPESFPEPLEGLTRVAPDARGASAPLRPAAPENLALVLFTSGSTGEPKAVALTHRNLCHLFAAADTGYPSRPGDTTLAAASVAFDVHVAELLYPLARGARVVLRETGPLGMARDILQHRATHLLATPSVITAALEEPEAPDAFRQLTHLQLGGEAPPESLVQRLATGQLRLLNGYGPSENTCFTTLSPLVPGVPIRLGRPLDRVRLYVLDGLGQPTPPGVPGELYIGGEGLSRGYQGRPALTAERFVPDPFSGTPGARLYRTGDRVRWNDDGTLGFLGRTDFQVKVRGVRIELEEVEAALLRQPGVRQAVVLARPHGRELRLEGFVAFADDTALTGEALRQALAAVLPDAMVPSRLTVLSTLPLTPNGKVDRKALAALPMEAPEALPQGEPPRGPVEELLAQLFCQVLGVETVRREDDFFHLGGHSLSATRLVARVRQSFGVELPLTALFSSPTVAGLAARLGTAPGRKTERLLPPTGERPSRVPASLVQERLWYALQLPEAPPFVVLLASVLEGALDADALETALAAVVERNETLRTTFLLQGETLFAQVNAETRPRLSRMDLSHLPPEESLSVANDIATRHGRQHFDLARGPLYRFELLQMNAEGTRHVLIASLSHLVMDGLGMQAFLDELATAYRATLAGQSPALPPAVVQYSDFARWQRAPEHLRQLEESLESWKQALANAPPVLDLPLDFPRRAPALNANMRPVRLTLRAEHVTALKALARQEGVSTFTALLALTQAWLHRLSAQEHVVVASPFSGRLLPETERMVGYFANVLPLCTDVSGNPSFRTLLKRSRDVVLHATTHQEVPFKRIVDAVQPDADRTAPPLAQALLMLDTFSAPGFAGLAMSDLEGEGIIPAYDVVVHLLEKTGGTLECTLATDGALFTPRTAERMSGAFEQLLSEVVRAPDAPLSRLSLLSPSQRAQVLESLDGGTHQVPAGACVHTLFEAQVRRTPDAPAVAHGPLTWSYAELNARANLLASRLVAQGLRPEERVGVVMEPSAQGLAVLLGILKAGGAYVPLDPGWPEPRKRLALERAGVKRLWVDAALKEAHEGLVPLVEVPPQPEQLAGESGPGPRAVPDSQLAYIIFTSGSTGEPKGVMVEHRSVVNHNLAIAVRFGLRPGDRMLQFAPLSFDAAAEDLYPPLAVGATVVMRNGLLPAHALTPYLEQEDITVISLPPTYIEEWIRQMDALGQRVPARLHLLAPGGDVLKRETYEGWLRVGGAHAPWLNVYGPTECTITSATCDIPGAEGVGTAATFPIGRPIPRVRIYLLDEYLEPVLPGLPGKVYIGGAALSRGYLGAPEMTAERFVPDPFAAEPGARMYHTGDLARMQSDGRLRFLGRADHQVKIRGFRVELSEIENCLRRFPEVEEAVVLARTSAAGLQQLCAWVQAPTSVRADALRAHVAAELPAYMVPAAFVVLERLPVNNNGKVDRQALPSPESVPTTEPENAEAMQEMAFRSTLEMRLQRLWSELLHQPDVGPEDDFFQLGGDSLLAMRMLGRMEEEFGMPVPLATLFQTPVLKDTADALQELLAEGGSPSSVVRLHGPDVPADAPALFLFHPGDGELHYYRHLTPLLEPRLRCFGIQAPETISQRTFATFAERIEAYVADIRAVQPHGPYRLLGYSFGGYPAYGVAAALEAAGERVELLAMIDTITTDIMKEVEPVRLAPELGIATMFEVMDANLERELAPLSQEARWEHVAARARERGAVAAHFTGKDLARMSRMIDEVLPPQISGWPVPRLEHARLLFFRASSTPTKDETLGWSQYVPRERIELVVLPGGHSSALEQPGVRELVSRLLAALG